MRRHLLSSSRSILVALFIAPVLLAPASSARPSLARQDRVTFPETGKTVSGRFLEYWRARGGLAQQGYPISEGMQERSDVNGKTYTVQYFERAVFELHPENAAPYDVLLSLLGSFAYRQKYPSSAPAEAANNRAGSRLFPETGKRLGGAFLEYWQRNGGLAQQGYPISNEFSERSALDGKTYTVQYFERAVFELHPDNQPPYNVLLSQLGTFRYRAKYGAHASAGSIEPAAAMSAPRACHNSVLLRSGTVLIAGGMEDENHMLTSAELYDPTTNTFTPTGSMIKERACSTATLLPDGRVLIAGGSRPGEWLQSAEIYDPTAGAFRSVGNMTERRDGHSATLLPNGKVLITGGYDGNMHATAELYDPANNTFTATGTMHAPRSAHTATLLSDGRVLVVGGGAKGTVLASAEIYDPASGTFSSTGTMSVPRYKHAAAKLPDGRVLIVGGSDNRDWRGRYSSAEIYDPRTGKFTATAGMGGTRFKLTQAVVVLNDGRPLIAGGSSAVELFDPTGAAFESVSGEVDTARFYSTATRLPDGRVLITGGYDLSIISTSGAWLYTP